VGRLRDPFGHLWLLSQRLEELSVSEIQRRRDAWAPPETLSKMLAGLARGPAPEQEATRQGSRRGASGRVHLIVGSVGAGKSTFALALCRAHSALRLDLDEWMAQLFRPDRPETSVVERYVERAGKGILMRTR
jgi:hypothetical protein